MKCDFCDFEDNESKLNDEKVHSGKWLKVVISKEYENLKACPKCARLILLFYYMIESKSHMDDPLRHNKPDPMRLALEEHIPGLKKKTSDNDDIKEEKE